MGTETSEHILKYEQSIQEFETSIGLPYNKFPGSIEEYKKYLSFSIEELQKLSSEECAYIGYRLCEFCLYLQRLINKYTALNKLLKSDINAIIAPTFNNYHGPWDIQRTSAILDNDIAQELNKISISLETKLTVLESMVNNHKIFIEQLKQIQFNKKQYER